MNAKKRQRLYLFSGAFIGAAAAVGLTLYALSGTITYFYTPSELAELAETPDRPIRLGGLVAFDSVVYEKRETGDVVTFSVTDGGAAIVKVFYKGILPDLFREGQGVVVQGRMTNEYELTASTVLAKHDETYMPKEVADALKEQGVWKDGESGE